jgi:hypothetical protein
MSREMLPHNKVKKFVLIMVFSFVAAQRRIVVHIRRCQVNIDNEHGAIFTLADDDLQSELSAYPLSWVFCHFRLQYSHLHNRCPVLCSGTPTFSARACLCQHELLRYFHEQCVDVVGGRKQSAKGHFGHAEVIVEEC